MSDKSQLATFRVDPQLWEEFKAQARRNGKSASDVLNSFVQSYADGEDTQSEVQLDDIEARIDARIDEAIAPIRQELAQLRADLPGKMRRVA